MSAAWQTHISPHRRKCGRNVGGRPVRQTGMDPDGRVNLRIGRCHHFCHGASGGEARYEHALWIDVMFGDNFAGDPGDDGRFASAPNLILRLEPIPAERWISALALDWINNEKSMLLGQGIHAGPCREVVRILRAAVQHDHQWAAAARVMLTWNVERVAPPSGSAGIGPA